ncbi:hypothetical protein HY380_00950 [Candidatus Saccharibacteria bacterium]|nr:hypothetical protein [Candidatus Saccharibacteria bacterium]
MAAVLLLAAALILFGGRSSADNVVFGFKAKGTIVPGNIVALDKEEVNTVILAPADDPGRIYGVAIQSKQAPITVQDNTSQVFVATSGSYPVIATNEKGDILTGDYISLSDQDGIAAKATDKTPFVLGRALEDFKPQASGNVAGKASVQISPGANPFLKNDIGVPKFLRRLAEAIAGKPLSAIRIYISLAMFLVGLLASAGLLSIGVKSGMIAIGRNPLSRHSVLQSIWQVIGIASTIFFISLVGIYLVLRL